VFRHPYTPESDQSRGPGAIRGLFAFQLRGSLLEDERQLHVDTEVLDRSVFCELDLVLRDPGPSNAIDALLGLGNALADGVLEGPGGSRCDLDHLRY